MGRASYSRHADRSDEGRLSNEADDNNPPKMSFKERLIACKEDGEQRHAAREERLQGKATEKIAAAAHKRKLQEQAQDQRMKDAELDRTAKKMKMLSDAHFDL